jgi:hypothetical protein
MGVPQHSCNQGSKLEVHNADYIRKIDYSAQSEASESKAAKTAKKAK